MPLQNSAPEPDLLCVRRRNYSQKHPEPSDVLLLVEVAESSLAEDQGEKLALYAEAGVTDYWIVNLLDLTFEVYRQPSGRSYLWSQKIGAGGMIAPIALPAADLAVDYLFPK